MNTNHSTNFRDFNALKSHINGREFNLAQQIIGLTVGNKRHDPEHHQPCPIRGCDSDDDAFYFREDKGTFHCRRCGFNGDFIDLVAAVRGISKTESFDIIAATSGYEATQLPMKAVASKSQYRIVHAVSAATDLVSVESLLQKDVSFLSGLLGQDTERNNNPRSIP